MHCPFCREQDTKVVDSRLVNDGDAVRRRGLALAVARGSIRLNILS